MSSKGLGRGLDALLRRTDMGAARQEKNDTPEKETGTEHSPTLLPLSHLHANPSQPRQTFDAESLAELAASIREQGIIQPLLVRPLADRPGHYQIVAGERRWRAARQAGLGQVPVHVREMSDAEVMAAALIENLQREDLNPMEEAQALQQLRETLKLTQEALAALPMPCACSSFHPPRRTISITAASAPGMPAACWPWAMTTAPWPPPKYCAAISSASP